MSTKNMFVIVVVFVTALLVSACGKVENGVYFGTRSEAESAGAKCWVSDTDKGAIDPAYELTQNPVSGYACKVKPTSLVNDGLNQGGTYQQYSWALGQTLVCQNGQTLKECETAFQASQP